jgi:FkbM family methyltransferase
MKVALLKAKALGQIFRHFRNPLMVSLMRLGVARLPLFLYRIQTRGLHYAMLARPTSNSMADLFVLREVFVEETYRDLLPLLRRGPVRAIDVGGNIGSFAVWLHRAHGLQECHCFEPDPSSFRLCRYNLDNNHCGFVRSIPKAVGGKGRNITMRVNTVRPGGNSIYAAAKGEATDTAEVEVVAFAEWMDTVSGEFDVLKLDCEGAEWEILDSTPPEVFHRFRIIIAEVHLDSTGKHHVNALAEHFARIGFKTLRWDGHEQGIYVGQRVAES